MTARAALRAPLLHAEPQSVALRMCRCLQTNGQQCASMRCRGLLDNYACARVVAMSDHSARAARLLSHVTMVLAQRAHHDGCAKLRQRDASVMQVRLASSSCVMTHDTRTYVVSTSQKRERGFTMSSCANAQRPMTCKHARRAATSWRIPSQWRTQPAREATRCVM